MTITTPAILAMRTHDLHSVRIGCLDVLDKDSLEVDSEHSK